MEIVILPGGELRCVYAETIDIHSLGRIDIRRGSYVEPDSQGQWLADLVPVNGPVLGPFTNRSQALAAEVAWLSDHWLRPSEKAASQHAN